MKRSCHMITVCFVLILLAALNGCHRRLSPEEFANYLKPKFTLKAHASPVLSMAFSPDGKTLVSADSTGHIVFWDPQTGEQKRATNFATISIYAMAYSLDGKYIAMAGKDKAIIIYDATNLMGNPMSFVAQSDEILALGFGPNDVLVAASCAQRDPRNWCQKGEIGVWKMLKFGEDPTHIKTFTDHTDWINAVAMTPDGKYVLTGGGDNVINIYETNNWTLVKSLQGHTARVGALSFPEKDSTRVGSAALDGTLRIWSIPDGNQEKLFKVDGDSFIAMDFSPDAKMVAAGGVGRKITIWETKSGKVLKSIENLEGQISSLAFSADGTEIAAAFYSNGVMIWKSEKP